MTELERLARVHWNATTDRFNQWDVTDDDERTRAIAAMRTFLAALREPSEAMLEAGRAQMVDWPGPNAIWQAMIDAALSGAE